MKKTLTRSLSLLLVLAMVLTFVPMSLAAVGDGGKVDVTANDTTLTLEEGKTVSTTLSAAVTAPEGYETTKYDWSVDNDGSITSSSSNATLTASKAGTYKVSVTVTFTLTADGTTTKTLAGSADVKVNAAQKLNSVTVLGKSEVQIGKSIGLAWEADPKDYTAKEVNWASTDDSIASVSKDGFVTGKSKGTVIISLTVDGVSAEHKVEVVEATTDVTVSDSITVTKDESEYITVKFDPEDAGKNAKITYASLDTSIATVTTSGRVTGKKAGKTTIGVKVANVDNCDDTTFEVDVTVTDESLTCDVRTTTASTSAKTLELKPKYSGKSDDVTLTYTKADSRGTIAIDDKGVVTATGPAAIRVKIEAKDKDGKVLASCFTGASFYNYTDVSVTMPKGNTTLRFSERSDIEESGNLFTKLTENYTTATNDRVYVTNLDTVEGTISGSSWISTERRTTTEGMRGLTFTVGTKGSASFNYEIVMGAYEDLPLLKGSVKIAYDGQVGRIEFSNTYDKALTLGEVNFEKFWTACKMKGGLDYIKINSMPSYGTLYTSKTNKTTSYAAKTTHEFYDGYTSSDSKNNSNAQDLDLLTYVPLSTKKETYDVVIPFTAYGDRSDEQVTGNIVIHMNEETNDITSRGVFFGTRYDSKNKLTYADQIADDFKETTGEKLSYVIFTLPEAEQAHLYRKIPSATTGGNTLVARGEHLSTKTKLYYDNTSSKVDWLEDAALIPAAGYTGKITLSYVAYNEDGKTEQNGTISFNVTSKTKSAVFSDVSGSYSWAADSVDFLYYEGTAQGANGKYNPANNITRGDFMLMLYRAFLEVDYGTYNVTSNFPDVVKGTSDYSKETYQAVGVAKYLGIAQGSNNKFNPKASITREEAMALIQRTLDKTNRKLDYSTTTRASSFNDYSSISTWARTAIDSLVQHGVIIGNNNKVNPKSNITRAEMACILHRVITY